MEALEFITLVKQLMLKERPGEFTGDRSTGSVAPWHHFIGIAPFVPLNKLLTLANNSYV